MTLKGGKIPKLRRTECYLFKLLGEKPDPPSLPRSLSFFPPCIYPSICSVLVGPESETCADKTKAGFHFSTVGGREVKSNNTESEQHEKAAEAPEASHTVHLDLRENSKNHRHLSKSPPHDLTQADSADLRNQTGL